MKKDQCSGAGETQLTIINLISNKWGKLCELNEFEFSAWNSLNSNSTVRRKQRKHSFEITGKSVNTDLKMLFAKHCNSSKQNPVDSNFSLFENH